MTTIQVRMDDSLKTGAERAFRAMGLSMSAGIRSYLNYVRAENKLPFEPKADPWRAHNESAHIPNARTAQAMRDAVNGVGVTPTSMAEIRAMWAE